MTTPRLLLVVVLASVFTACGSATVDPTITIDSQECTSSDPANWPEGALNIDVSNNTNTSGAVVIGTYTDGFGRDDLVAYGSDVTTRPLFIEALEIFETFPGTTSSLLFDHGPGTYFMVCMPDNNTMVVLDDVTIEG